MFHMVTVEKKKPITALADGFCWVEKQVTWVCFFIMLIIMVIQVLCRYVFDAPLAWAEEMIRYIYLAVSFIGAAIAVRETSHISISILPAIVSGLTRHNERKTAIVLKVTDIFADLVGVIFWAWMTLKLSDYVMDVKLSGQLSVANQWPMWLIYIPVVVSGGLMTFHYILNIIERITDNTVEEKSEQAEAEGGGIK